MRHHETARRTLRALATTAALALLALGAAACGEEDPGALGIQGIEGVSDNQQRQDYVSNVANAIALFGVVNTPDFARAVDSADAKQLQAIALQWDQGVAQLKQVNPPKDAVAAHTKLVDSTEALGRWNHLIVEEAPDKKATQAKARMAGVSPASELYAEATCELVDLGYEVVDPGACSPFDDASSPVG